MITTVFRITCDGCGDYIDPDLNHGYHHDRWQPVRDKVAKWCGAK